MPGDSFRERIFRRHVAAAATAFPATSDVCTFSSSLLNWLFPEQTGHFLHTEIALAEKYEALREQLEQLLSPMEAQLEQPATATADLFFQAIPALDDMLNKDATAILEGDPAATSRYEVIRAYPGFYALAFYRMAHILYTLGVPLLPRLMTEFAHNRTGIDIHPGAKIGAYCCIDHGTGIVIGETTVIGEHVKIYQGVTLGALSVEKTMALQKRHPTIEDHVVIYAGATILGGETVVGHHSIIGGNVWLIRSVAPNARIYYKADEHISISEQIL